MIGRIVYRLLVWGSCAAMVVFLLIGGLVIVGVDRFRGILEGHRDWRGRRL